jgi:intracellular sulfur oxidation DsrE/DsrF family protein
MEDDIWRNFRMKKFLLCIAFPALFSPFVQAQVDAYQVVFDMSSRDSVNQQTVVREIGLITGANPDAKLEVVIYGQGLDLVVKDRSTQQSAVQQLIAGGKASFKVCAMTMKRNNISNDQLVPGVEVVPDGIYEIISKQKAGWGYIKVGH